MVNMNRLLRLAQVQIFPASFTVYVAHIVSTGHLFPFMAHIPVVFSFVYALIVLRNAESGHTPRYTWDGILATIHFCALWLSFVGLLSDVEVGWHDYRRQSDGAIAAGSFCIVFTFIDLFIHLWFWSKSLFAKTTSSCPNCGTGYTQVKVAGDYTQVRQDDEETGLFTDVDPQADNDPIDQDAKLITNPTVDDMYNTK